MKASSPQLADIMIHNRTKPAQKFSTARPAKPRNNPLETRSHTSPTDSSEKTAHTNSNSAQADADSDNSKENFEKVLEKRINSKAEKKEENRPVDSKNADSEDAEKTASTGIPIAEITPANQENKAGNIKAQAINPEQSGKNTQKTQGIAENTQDQINSKEVNTAAGLKTNNSETKVSESKPENGKSAEQSTTEKPAAKQVNDVQGNEPAFKRPKNSKKIAEIAEKSPEIDKNQVPKNKAGLNQQGKPKTDNIPEEAIKTGIKTDTKPPKSEAAAAEQVDTKQDIKNKQMYNSEIKTENKTIKTAADLNKPVADDTVKPATINTQPKPETGAGKENLRNNIDIANPDKLGKIDVDDMPKPVQQNVSEGAAEVQTAAGKINVKPGTATQTLNQVIRGIESSNLRSREQISMALDPPELGRVHIRFQQRNGELVGVISADKVRTQQDISDEMPALMRSLQNSGVAVKKVEVVLTEEGRQDMLKQENRSADFNDNQNQDTGRGSDQSDSQGQRRQTHAKNFTSAYKPANPENPHQQSTNEDAINVYM